ncbi:acetyl-CoA carboxylase, carboxyltransferase subunit beta [Exiguobacterium alkaliphilum]|uniref:acetyl-CoA carboxylase, carboxyltransferase subunit beta n=1 Tax=Exiguobacterium alkaliphilum TaxID=1428684 RepID=UPI001BAA1A5B|nr:acetyl-CoA carboxylase, carboxyltransferase subunit beta [Exiguobacterium alkaliphilum]QUE87637.1 acetyl-CoA carboxylase carboxyltransferase subunit beta [Exiguobacterium alkaliphilum]
MTAFFKKPKRYMPLRQREPKIDAPQGLMTKCPACKYMHYTKQLNEHHKVCDCGYHFPLSADERIAMLVDSGSFEQFAGPNVLRNPLDFPEYEEKLAKDKERTGIEEAIVCGRATISGQPFVVCVMDARFRMGSMGAYVGEAIASAVRRATAERLPVVLFTASGGARMQEGMVSLMQMANTSIALKKHDEAGLLYIAYLTHPTTGGVSASFAMLGDLNVAEPGALIGFAGRRIIEQTIREKLPENFQTAEFLLEAGQLDAVVHREQMRTFLHNMITLHGGGVNRV